LGAIGDKLHERSTHSAGIYLLKKKKSWGKVPKIDLLTLKIKKLFNFKNITYYVGSIPS
jgi:hypothetical protein